MMILLIVNCEGDKVDNMTGVFLQLVKLPALNSVSLDLVHVQGYSHGGTSHC
jgi:hypothetical protein